MRAVAVAGCWRNDRPVTPAALADSADLILTNGRIYTVDAERALGGGRGHRRRAHPGRRRQRCRLALRGPDTRVIDLAGAFVTPGFNDAHVHVDSTGNLLTGVNLLDVHEPAHSRTGRGATRRLPEGSWILRGDWGAYEQWGQGSAGNRGRRFPGGARRPGRSRPTAI
jgi:cytosine/adenosine deaminase-related metal-dependent hydrolase